MYKAESMESDNVGKIFMPGEKVLKFEESSEQGKVVIGPGLKRLSSALVSTKAGVLRHKEPNIWWIDSCQKRVSLMWITQYHVLSLIE